MPYVFKRGDEIRTDNGWHFVVTRTKLWSKTSGVVYGLIVDKDGERSTERYLGTVDGLRMVDPLYRDMNN